MDEKEIGKNIKTIRQMKNITREELAKKINVSYSSIEKHEQGLRGFKIDTINKFADALEVSVYQLIGERPLPKTIEELYDETEKELELKKGSYPNTLSEEEKVKELVDFMLITTKIMNSQLIDKKQKHELAEIFQTVVAQWSKYMNNDDHEKAIEIYNLYSNITKIE